VSGSHRFLRPALVVAGLLVAVLALSADSIGLSRGEGISRNQAVIAVIGAAVATAAILGRRLPAVWRGLGLLLLNTLLVLVLLDLAALAALKLLVRDDLPDRIPAERIAGIRRAQSACITGEYEPYLVWRARPLQIGMETSDSLGNRTTTGNPADPDAFEVLFFGGSAAWGAGVPDSSTIPSLLREMLAESLGVPVRVVNMGQISWVSTQEMIQLSMLLRDGARPDAVITFDGFNDVCTAFDFGRAGVHWDYQQVRSRIEGEETSGLRSRAFLILLEETSTYQLLRRLGVAGALSSPPPGGTRPMSAEARPVLAADVAAVFSGNLGFVDSMAASYGFLAIHALQPTIWTGDKPLTPDEEPLLEGVEGFRRNGTTDEFLAFLHDSYEEIRQAEAGNPRFVDLTDVFDGVDRTVYTDAAGCHFNEAGNRLIAEILCRQIIGGIPAR
jgi:lysophospholipase L1-like esterase